MYFCVIIIILKIMYKRTGMKRSHEIKNFRLPDFTSRYRPAFAHSYDKQEKVFTAKSYHTFWNSVAKEQSILEQSILG